MSNQKIAAVSRSMDSVLLQTSQLADRCERLRIRMEGINDVLHGVVNILNAAPASLRSSPDIEAVLASFRTESHVLIVEVDRINQHQLGDTDQKIDAVKHSLTEMGNDAQFHFLATNLNQKVEKAEQDVRMIRNTIINLKAYLEYHLQVLNTSPDQD